MINIRLIDADKLIQDVGKTMDENLHNDGKIKMNHRNEHIHFLTMIHKQPTVDDWIPVTEGLPEEKQEFLDILDEDTLAIIDTRHYKASDLVLVTVKDYDKDEVFGSDDATVNGEWSNYNIKDVYEVIAWKPMPKPYIK